MAGRTGGTRKTWQRALGTMAALSWVFGTSGCIATGFPFWGNPPEQPILPPPQPAPFPDTFGTQMARMLEQIHKLEDERKALLSRLQRQDQALSEKDQLLNQSAAELEKSLETLAKTRRDLENNRDELTRVKSKLDQVEKNDRAALESILESLEKLAGTQKKLDTLPKPVIEGDAPKRSGGN